MIFQERETVELKEIIAFANCEGGKLYIGVQDDGTVSVHYIDCFAWFINAENGDIIINQ